jgi:hypothetical protein
MQSGSRLLAAYGLLFVFLTYYSTSNSGGGQFDEEFSLGSYTARFACRGEPRRTSSGIWSLLQPLLGFPVSAVPELFAMTAVLTVFAAIRSVLRPSCHALPTLSPALPALSTIPTLLLLGGCYHPSMVKAVRSGSHSAIQRSSRPTATAAGSATSDYQKVKGFWLYVPEHRVDLGPSGEKYSLQILSHLMFVTP